MGVILILKKMVYSFVNYKKDVVINLSRPQRRSRAKLLRYACSEEQSLIVKMNIMLFFYVVRFMQMNDNK
jgi:hypothetical protein